MKSVAQRAKEAADDMNRRHTIDSYDQAINCLFMYLYNVSPLQVAVAVYGADNTPSRLSYLEGKADEIRNNPVRWYGSLDNTSRRNLATAIVDRYSESIGYLA